MEMVSLGSISILCEANDPCRFRACSVHGWMSEPYRGIDHPCGLSTRAGSVWVPCALITFSTWAALSGCLETSMLTVADGLI